MKLESLFETGHESKATSQSTTGSINLRQNLANTVEAPKKNWNSKHRVYFKTEACGGQKKKRGGGFNFFEIATHILQGRYMEHAGLGYLFLLLIVGHNMQDTNRDYSKMLKLEYAIWSNLWCEIIESHIIH